MEVKNLLSRKSRKTVHIIVVIAYCQIFAVFNAKIISLIQCDYPCLIHTNVCSYKHVIKNEKVAIYCDNCTVATVMPEQWFNYLHCIPNLVRKLHRLWYPQVSQASDALAGLPSVTALLPVVLNRPPLTSVYVHLVQNLQCVAGNVQVKYVYLFNKISCSFIPAVV